MEMAKVDWFPIGGTQTNICAEKHASAHSRGRPPVPCSWAIQWPANGTLPTGHVRPAARMPWTDGKQSSGNIGKPMRSTHDWQPTAMSSAEAATNAGPEGTWRAEGKGRPGLDGVPTEGNGPAGTEKLGKFMGILLFFGSLFVCQ